MYETKQAITYTVSYWGTDANVEEFMEQTTSMIKDSQQIAFDAMKSYTTTNAFNEYRELVSTQFKQTADDFTFQFNNITGDITKLNGETNAQFQEIEKYIRFENGNIVLGQTGNQITLRIQNDRILFIQDNNVDNPVAYLSDNKLYITDAEILNSIQLGNFAFKPRQNGSLSFGKSNNRENN